MNNIFKNIPLTDNEEIVDKLLEFDNICIERIVSNGENSPENFWYEQKSDEWVILIQGKAVIEYENSQIAELKRGDYIFIPSMQKHRVKQVSKNPNCIWVAVHFNKSIIKKDEK